MESVDPEEVHAPLGGHSQVVVAGNLIFTAGQVALDKDSNLVGHGDVAQQTEQVLANIAAVLNAVGASLDHVVSCTTWLRRMEDWEAYDVAFRQVFTVARGDGQLPARTTIGAELTRPEFLVEITAIAVKDAKP